MQVLSATECYVSRGAVDCCLNYVSPEHDCETLSLSRTSAPILRSTEVLTSDQTYENENCKLCSHLFLVGNDKVPGCTVTALLL